MQLFPLISNLLLLLYRLKLNQPACEVRFNRIGYCSHVRNVHRSFVASGSDRKIWASHMHDGGAWEVDLVSFASGVDD